MHLRACIAALAILLASGVVVGQQRDVATGAGAPPPGTAVIAGAVWADGEQTAPVRRAIVTLTGTGITRARTTVTNDRGRFQSAAFPAGPYVLSAEKPAYVSMYYGSPALGRGPGAPIALTDGQHVDLSIRLPKGAVLTGVLRDDAGRPMASGQIRLLSATRVNGEVRWLPVRTQVPIVTTDERGRYRIYGLPPGEYVVRGSASPVADVRLMTSDVLAAAERDRQQRAQGQAPPTGAESAPRVAWVTAYAPGVSDPSLAQSFSLREGQEYTGADVTLSLGRVARVSGTMVGPDGGPVVTPQVGIINTRERTTWASPGAVRPDAQGAFTLPSLGPGEYAFVGKSGDSLYAMTPFVVFGQDVTGIRMEFAPGGTVSGRVEGMTTPLPSTAQLTLAPVDAIPGMSLGAATATPDRSGAFRFTGVAPGQYRIAATGLGSAHLQSAWLHERDTLDSSFTVTSGSVIEGLRVVVSDVTTVVSGTLLDQRGRPAPEFAVVVFSTEREHWSSAPRRMSGVIRLDSTAGFRVTGLPAGRYYLAAVTDASPQLLADTLFLEELAASAVIVTLVWGEEARQDLKLSGG